MAFFRKIFDEIAPEFPGVEFGYNYVDPGPRFDSAAMGL
jgi:hypothetical protein